MARGWESKQVEEQQAEASRGRDETARRTLTPEEQASKQRRDTLLLAAARTRAAIAASRAPAHRGMLQLQLEAIEREIDGLGMPAEHDR